MEQYLPWDLERLTRQYIGFNDQIIKEYHQRFEEDCGAVYVKPTFTTGYGNRLLVLQWRNILNVTQARGMSSLKYILSFRRFIQPNKERFRLDYMEAIKSLPLVLFLDNAYRASTLR